MPGSLPNLPMSSLPHIALYSIELITNYIEVKIPRCENRTKKEKDYVEKDGKLKWTAMASCFSYI